MKNRIELAKKGRDIWLSYVKKYKIDNRVYVILLPDAKREYNEPALFYLKEFLEYRSIKKALVLSYDEWVLGMREQYHEFTQIEKCGKEDMEALLQFYCLYEFAPNIVIASLEKPAGRLGTGFIRKKGLNTEEIFKGIVYGLVD